MTATLEEIDERVKRLMAEVPTRGIERHPMILKHIGELSTELQSPEVTSLDADSAIQTIIAFPPQIQHGWTYVPKQALLFSDSKVIHLLASIWPGQDPKVTTLNGSGLIYMNVTLILLYGCLEICGMGSDSPTTLITEFNTVAWDQISIPLRRLLEATKTQSNEPSHKESVPVDVNQKPSKLPLKFSNGLKLYGLLPGEKLEDMVFQTGEWKRKFLVIKKPISANTLMLLTSNYMIIIREELGFQYGWIITYIPRNCIVGIQNQIRETGNELTIRLKRGEQSTEYKLPLMNEATEQWKEVWKERGFRWEEVKEEV